MTRVAAWDADLVRAAAAGLAAVAERLPSWRLRLEAVGREMEGARCWSGPAAREASGAVVELAGAATMVGRSFDRSLEAFFSLSGQVREASDLAVRAIALARGAGVTLGDDGSIEGSLGGVSPAIGAARAPDRAGPVDGSTALAAQAAALARDALGHGALARAAAAEADATLRAVGVVDAFAPADFAGLAAVTGVAGPVRVPAPPPGRSPTDVGSWWSGLTAAEQRSAIAHEPALVGALDGVPAWARDRANRALLARLLASTGSDVVATVAAQLSAAEATGAHVQLYEFDPVTGRAAVAIGDVDTASALAILVPGIRTTISDDLGSLVIDAEAVAAAAQEAGPGLAVAAIAWLGYRTPQTLPEILTRTDARRGGRELDDALDGLAVAREIEGAAPPRTTVIAHSYGTVVVDEAAERPGRLDADAVVLMGSPGMGRGGAAALEAPEVYDATGLADPVPAVSWFGQEPWERDYGAEHLPTDRHTGHSDYYDPRRPTLAALGGVVAGAAGPR